MDDSYIIDNLLPGGQRGPGGLTAHRDTRWGTSCCLPFLVCPHVEGSWVTAKDEENVQSKVLGLYCVEQNILPESARLHPTQIPFLPLK